MSNNDRGESVTLANPCHPGEVIRDWIDGHRETITNTAKRLGVSRATLNRILTGKSRVSADTALRLEGLGWSNADFWLRLQSQFDLAQERGKAKAA